MELKEFLNGTGLHADKVCDCFQQLIGNSKIVDATFVDFDRNTAVLLTVDFPIKGKSRTGVPQIGTYKVFRQDTCKTCDRKDVWITADKADYWSFPGLISLSHARMLSSHIGKLAKRGDELIYKENHN